MFRIKADVKITIFNDYSLVTNLITNKEFKIQNQLVLNRENGIFSIIAVGGQEEWSKYSNEKFPESAKIITFKSHQSSKEVPLSMLWDRFIGYCYYTSLSESLIHNWLGLRTLLFYPKVVVSSELDQQLISAILKSRYGHKATRISP